MVDSPKKPTKRPNTSRARNADGPAKPQVETQKKDRDAAGLIAKEIQKSAASSSTARPQRRTTSMTTAPKETPQSAWDAQSHFDLIDAMGSPILVTDKSLVVIHANEAAKALFAATENTGVDAAKLLGADLTLCAASPTLSASGGASKLNVKGAVWEISVKPVAGGENFVVEIADVTASHHLSTEAEILSERVAEMSDAQVAGDLEAMLFDGEFKHPAFFAVASKVNKMVQAHVDTAKAVTKVFDAFADGDYTADLAPQPGAISYLNKCVNKTRDNFTAVLDEIRRLSNAINEGKLDIKSKRAEFKGSYQEVVDAFDNAFTSLNAAFGALSTQVSQVGQTVGQMRSASQELATNSQIASSSVDEVSASAEETDMQVKANAEAAKNAAILVTANAEVAAEGKRKIDEMVTAMEGINASSQDIAKIIKVIDEIAFQTNLLALNAAVEAARAGQHGRGFAVVAQEVRNLAGRSAKAARETSDLIEGATSRVSAGVRLAGDTSESFEKIAVNISQVKTLVETINRASEEQSRGVAQINVAIGEVARTALATSQQAEQLAATSAEMTVATESMGKELSRYSLREVTADTADLASRSGFENLSPEVLAKIQQVLGAQSSASPQVALSNGHVNGGGTDFDERGFSNF